MNLEQVEKIADAVLYEGYMLYPYRPSSIKNRQRWNFGVLYSPSFCERQSGSEASWMQTECLVRATPFTRLTIKVRFLQVVRRSIGRFRTSERQEAEGVEAEFELVERLEVAGRIYQPWQEAVERELSYTVLDPALLPALSAGIFTFPEEKSFQYLHDEEGMAIGVIVRKWEALTGTVQFDSKPCRDGIVKVTVRVENRKCFDPALGMEPFDRESAILYSLVSAHTILGVEDGELLSLLDPPAGFENLASQCKNVGTWPVLTGDHGESLLSSPIILYDHPEIARESVGNLFDSTEIDEILSLRILTLTDDEKREMRQGDDRTREILERTENMPDEQLMKLHGVLRGLTPLKEEMR